ncbi:uncharacterized protein LAESUDRAFT_724042 [Laetiporus sulphureus 93-53]|uniref:F-box domain-containing protein n=1 Tax=Laetiporus sulphureus 93-53 TaxID=1314785 RepID=A0A165EZP5_9APHY|nr:uncharacterized protein LAESUDRAFT_724042 [Laetiporus sulphureus 93-53]KZT08057.1 hypothetical protein LAESUDRAFT_724042 [Laetiporus sulphureus 93-53]
MANFLDLPSELLPVILRFLIRPSHIAVICLVNKSFYTFSVPYLYERVYIYAWHKEGKGRVVQLFRTLSGNRHLANYVRKLEIRDFPKALQSADYEELVHLCLNGIKNCVSLRACTWTRHGSVRTDIFEALLTCPQLRELEINGQHYHQYQPSVLARFASLHRISLIMPSHAVIDILPTWMKATGNTLRSLSLICKSSSSINDDTLRLLAPHLVNLEQLYIAGCPKVTDKGLWDVIASNSQGLHALGMEGLSPAFDMSHFSKRCASSGALSRLRSITLSVREQHPVNWDAHVLSLLASAPLEHFHISTVGGLVGPALDERFCTAIVDAHGSRLRRFSVHRMRMNISSIADICRRCPQLEQLFIVVEQTTLDSLGSVLALARCVRAVHVNRPLDVGSEDVSELAHDKILSIVRQCVWTLTQFGYNTAVFQVERAVRRREDGSMEMEVCLAPYENPEIARSVRSMTRAVSR